MHVWDIKADGEEAECKVYYEDTVRTFSCDELGGVEHLTVSDIDKFCDRINMLKARSAETPLTGFEKIELLKFFEPAASEYIWYKCGMNPSFIEDLMSHEMNRTLPRFYNFCCIFDGSKWLIKAIIPITARLLR